MYVKMRVSVPQQMLATCVDQQQAWHALLHLLLLDQDIVAVLCIQCLAPAVSQLRLLPVGANDVANVSQNRLGCYCRLRLVAALPCVY